MTESIARLHPPLFLATVLNLVVAAGVGHAQTRGDCSKATHRAVGLAAGRSLTPYFELSQGVVDAPANATVLLRGSLQLAGRLDVPIAGPWRGRVEVAGANWRVEHQRYGTDFQPIATDTVGKIEARQIVALVGRQGGRSPACGYVLAGGGIYSLAIESTRLRRPGIALSAGIDLPLMGRGGVQLDAQVHMIGTDSRRPVSSSGALAASISVGWSHRF